MACTFDSPCLTSMVNGAQPSFAFASSNTAYFGIPASFTSSGTKCYTETLGSWSPILYMGSYTASCIWAGGVQSLYCPGLKNSAIPTGTHTLSYVAPSGFAPFSPTSFWVSTAESTGTLTVTESGTKIESPITVTSTTTNTVPYATITLTSTSSVKQTQYLNTTQGYNSTQTVSSTLTTYSPTYITTTSVYPITQTTTYYTTLTPECSSSSSSTPSSSYTSTNSSYKPTTSSYTPTTSSSTSSTSTVQPTGSCPNSDGQVIDGFIVECYSDRNDQGSDLSTTFTNSLKDCIDSCRNTTGCVDVSYIPGTPGPCYLKSKIVPIVTNSGIWGARSSGYVNPTTTSTPTTTTSSSQAAATTFTQCPNNNGTIYTASSGDTYLVECGIDRSNYDLAGNPVIVQASNLGACIEQCDQNSQCVDVSLSGIACYLKSGQGTASSNAVIAGARLISSAKKGYSSSTTVARRAVTPAPSHNSYMKRLVLGLGGTYDIPAPCTGPCTGWGGPDTTYTRPSSVRTTTTIYTTTTTPTISKTIVATMTWGNITVTSTDTNTYTQTVYSTISGGPNATTTALRTSTVPVTYTNTVTIYSTSTSSVYSTYYASCTPAVTTMTKTSTYTTTSTVPRSSATPSSYS